MRLRHADPALVELCMKKYLNVCKIITPKYAIEPDPAPAYVCILQNLNLSDFTYAEQYVDHVAHLKNIGASLLNFISLDNWWLLSKFQDRRDWNASGRLAPFPLDFSSTRIPSDQ
jgi:hypothetical protein